MIVAIAGLSSCGGGVDRREQVSEYVREVNRVQQASTPAFTHANDAYRAFSQGQLPPGRAVPVLARAEEDIGRARVDVARIEPPDAARRLHARLLKVFDMNLAFARDTAQLARYQTGATEALRPLRRHNERLQADLADAGGGAEQVQALSRYHRALQRTLRGLRALVAPPLTRPAHEQQLRRLDSSARVVLRLRRAVERRDARAVARLLLSLRGDSSPRSSAIDRAFAAYDRRHRLLTRAYADVQREHGRLNRTLD